MKKRNKLLFIILTIFSIIFVSYYLYQKLFIGERSEREELLEAVVWKLQEQGYTNVDIKSINIKYNSFTGGEIPYGAYVVFEKNQSKEIIYTWNHKNKSYIEEVGYSSH